MNNFIRLFPIFPIFLLFIGLSAGTAEAKRVALVIANSKYSNASALENPASDARLIAKSLENAGFDSVDVKYDLGKTALESELRDFGRRSDGADVSLVYYAGHGIEAGGQNYLIPVDARLQRDRDLEIEATRLETALLMVEGGRLKIIVLDACRNNPFTATMQRTMRNRSVGRGLAPVEPEGETLVVYAAKAGATAADGEGANSPFAEALASRLVQPGLEISLLFRSVRDDVLKKTGRQQEPFTYGSLSGKAFYFVPGQQNAATVGTQPVPAPPSISAETSEALYWQGTVSANSENAYRSYLEQYPAGRYASLAQENIARINAPPAKLPGVNGFSVPSFSNVIGPGAVGSGADLNAANLRALDFKVSSAVRKKTTENFLKQLEAGDKSSADLFRFILGSQDVFPLMEAELQKYGMRTNNMADAFSTMIGTLHDAANGQVTVATRAQAQGLRNQMAKLLLLTPKEIPSTDAGKQELADLMLLNALVLGASLESAKVNPQLMKQFSDQVSEMTKTQMNLDLKSMVLTDNGFEIIGQ